MGYELWDNKTLNLIDALADEAQALAAVREVIVREGPDAVASWALDRVGDSDAPLQGRALVERALARLPA